MTAMIYQLVASIQTYFWHHGMAVAIQKACIKNQFGTTVEHSCFCFGTLEGIEITLIVKLE